MHSAFGAQDLGGRNSTRGQRVAPARLPQAPTGNDSQHVHGSRRRYPSRTTWPTQVSFFFRSRHAHPGEGARLPKNVPSFRVSSLCFQKKKKGGDWVL